MEPKNDPPNKISDDDPTLTDEPVPNADEIYDIPTTKIELSPSDAEKMFHSLVSIDDKLFHTIFHILPHGCIICRIVTNSEDNVVDCRLLDLNDAFAEMIGVSREESIGKTLLEVLPSSNESWIQIIGNVATQNTITHEQGKFAGIDTVFEVTAICPKENHVACLFFDTTEYHDDMTAITEEKNQIQGVSRRLMDILEYERKRMVTELQEHLMKHLSVLGTNIGMIHAFIDEVSNKKASKMIDNVIEKIGKISRRMRALQDDIRPSILDDSDLIEALRWYIDRLSKHTSTLIFFDTSLESLTLDKKTTTTLFRIVQEALRNVAQHARASKAYIYLEKLTIDPESENSDQFVTLMISDEGAGFDLAKLPPPRSSVGWGLPIMRERAESVQGSLQVVTNPGKGTQIIVQVPLVSNRTSIYP